MRKLTQRLIIVITFIITISCISCPVMAASNEKAITKQIDKYMNGVKECNYKKLKKLSVSGTTINTWSAAPKFIKHLKTLHSYTSYSVKSINIKGNKATVKVDVEYYDIYEDARKAFLTTFLKSKKSWSSNKFMNVLTQNEVKEYKLNLNSSADLQAFKQNYLIPDTLKIEMTKVDGKWLISKYNRKMYYFMDCDFSEFLDNVSEDYSILF